MKYIRIYTEICRAVRKRFLLWEQNLVMGAEFRFPVLPFVGATAILLGICIAVPVMAYQKIEKSGSLIERIRVTVE